MMKLLRSSSKFLSQLNVSMNHKLVKRVFRNFWDFLKHSVPNEIFYFNSNLLGMYLFVENFWVLLKILSQLHILVWSLILTCWGWAFLLRIFEFRLKILSQFSLWEHDQPIVALTYPIETEIMSNIVYLLRR